MKGRFSLPGSLALNAMLVLAIGYLWRPTTPRAGRVAASPNEGSGGATNALLDVRPRTVSGGGAATAASAAFQWSELRTQDWAAYRDDLLAIGCPRSVVRSILVPLVERHYAGLTRERLEQISARFWEWFNPPAKERMDTLEKDFADLDQEQDRVIEELFAGGGDSDEPGFLSEGENRRALRSFLPESKQAELLEIERRFDRAKEAAARGNTNIDEVRAALDRLQVESEREVERRLSPEEREEYLRRQSRHTGLQNLEGIELTEAELARIIDLRRAADSGGGEAWAKAQTEVEVLLGSERAAALKRAESPAYEVLAGMARKLGMEPEAAGNLWALQEEFGNAARRIAEERDHPLAWDEQRAALAKLEQEWARRSEAVLPDARARETWNRTLAKWRRSRFSPRDASPISSWRVER